MGDRGVECRASEFYLGRQKHGAEQHDRRRLRASGNVRDGHVSHRRTCGPAGRAGSQGSGLEITRLPDRKGRTFRKGPLQLDAQTVYFGFVAEDAGGDIVAVVRGTDGFIEWIEDAEFLPVIYQPKLVLQGGPPQIAVEQGFWTLYQTLELTDTAGTGVGDAASQITALAGRAQNVMVIGHSLGSALATYLALDLARGTLGGRVSACLFASPHTGNKAFTDLFDQTVKEYRLFNYILDIVPRVPLGPDYVALPRRTVIQPSTAEASIRFDVLCNHHVVCYCAMLDYEGTKRAITPVPPGEEDSVPCILGPEIGQPSLAKQLVSDLAGIVPV